MSGERRRRLDSDAQAHAESLSWRCESAWRATTFFIVALVALSTSQVSADLYYWDANGGGAGIGGTGTWDFSNPPFSAGTLLWRLGSETNDPLVKWQNTGDDIDAILAGVVGTITLDANATIYVNDITVAPDTPGIYTIAGVSGAALYLRGKTVPVIDVASSSTLTITSGLRGLIGLTKTGTGILALDSAITVPNQLFGGVTVSNGTLQLGSSQTNNNGSAQVLRSNAVYLAPGTFLTSVGNSNTEIRVGQLTGGGTVTPGNNGALTLIVSTDASFAGTLTTTGGFSIRGNGGVQTLTGNVAGLSGETVVYGSSYGGSSIGGLLLAGNAALTAVGTTISLRGGSLTLDNSSANTDAGVTTNRLLDTAGTTVWGGTFSLLGNSTFGTTESVGTLTIRAGLATVRVVHNGGLADTTLGFNTFARGVGGTLIFSGEGGTLGSAAVGPKILFSTRPGLVNGVIANSDVSSIIGFALVKSVSGFDFAGYDNTFGVVPVTSTPPPVSNPLSSGQNVLLNGSATIGATASFNTLKINAGAGATLDLTSSGNISTSAILLDGANNFTIQNTGTGTGGLGGSADRHIFVAQAGTILNIGVKLNGSQQAVVKSGDGFLALTGTANLMGFTSTQDIYLDAGVLRATVGSLGGGTSSGGARTTLKFRGGVLEIDGGGNAGAYSRAIDVAGTASGGGLTFDEGTTDRGSGGFSAYNGDATIKLVATIGSTNATSLVWNDGKWLADGAVFLLGSIKSDSRLTFTNNIGLDSGTALSGYSPREFRVIDNPNSTTDVAQLSGVITGSTNAGFVKSGGGTLELTQINTYDGGTTVAGGTLAILSGGSIKSFGVVSVASGATLDVRSGASIAVGGDVITSGTVLASGAIAAPVTVATGGVLTGAGSVGGVNLQTGGKVSPGEGVGKLTAADGAASTWYGGAEFSFQFKNADTNPGLAGTQGTEGTDWDYLDLGTGALIIGATSIDRITIRIDSFSPLTSMHGAADNFNPALTYQWHILHAGGGITFTSGSDVFLLNATTDNAGVFGSNNPFTPIGSSQFYVTSTANDLYLNYSAVPEPSSLILTFIAASSIPLHRIRRRRKRDRILRPHRKF
ncbi:MAG: hypothetical protein C0483_03730 [Pirellula sp.]|nr:hypothetical protein [Pirellula sp.]